jgi:hypothetical protein
MASARRDLISAGRWLPRLASSAVFLGEPQAKNRPPKIGLYKIYKYTRFKLALSRLSNKNKYKHAFYRYINQTFKQINLKLIDSFKKSRVATARVRRWPKTWAP